MISFSQWLSKKKVSEFLHHFLECDCQTGGTIDQICGKSDGKCLCKTNVDGTKCDQCKGGFYGYPQCDKSN